MQANIQLKYLIVTLNLFSGIFIFIRQTVIFGTCLFVGSFKYITGYRVKLFREVLLQLKNITVLLLGPDRHI